jgi:type III secretion system chaperone SycN
MNWVDQTIAAFGQTIGIPGLSLSPNGSVDLVLEHGGSLSLRHLGDSVPAEVVVQRSKPLEFAPERQIRRALRLSDFRHPSSWPTQVAVDDDLLILAMRMPERSFSLDSLEQAISELVRMHAFIAEGR